MTNLLLSDYVPAPFWFLNHKLEQAELNRQLRLMKSQGINACFLHPRAGLRTPYGTEEWFTLMRNTALEAKRLGMKAWLYDEDPFPSGMAGGRIFFDHPEYAARGLVFQEISPDKEGNVVADLGEHRLIEAVAVQLDAKGNVLRKRDIFDCVGVLRDEFFECDWLNPYYHHLVGKTTYFQHRASTAYPHLQLETKLPKGWKAFVVTAQTYQHHLYRFIPDNMNPDCAREFLRLTHKKYEEKLGDLFGDVIPGIFTDETAVGGSMPWTPKFEEEFLKLRKFAITGKFHLLFRGNTEEARNLRLAYWKTVQELFEDAFFKPIYNWCRKNRLVLTGHEIGEEFPLCGTNGLNNYALQKWFGVPGFDHITPNIPNWSDFTSLNLGGILVSSAAEQKGNPRVMSECLACNAYNFGHDGMKRDMHWLYSLGINFLVPHGFHYSYDGFRKDDAGKSFFFQSPDWEEFHKFAEYAARLGYRLGKARAATDICVFFPDSEFRRLYPGENDLALEKVEQLYVVVQSFLQQQIPFEFADDQALRDAVVTKEGFRVGKKFYRHLVIPFALTQKDALARFRPFLRTMREIGKIHPFRVLDATTGKPAKTVICQYRNSAEGKLLYFFHNDAKPASFRITMDGMPNWYLYDAEKDAQFVLTEKSVISLPPHGAAMVEFRSAPVKGCRPYKDAVPPVPDYSFLSEPQWDYVPSLPNLVAAISKWDFKGGDEQHAGKRYAYLRDIFGSDGPYPKRLLEKCSFDRAPVRPKFFPTKVTATASFQFPASATGKAQLLLEHDTLQGNCTVTINGKAVPPFVRKRVYDPWNLVADISKLVKKGKTPSASPGMPPTSSMA